MSEEKKEELLIKYNQSLMDVQKGGEPAIINPYM